MDEGQRRIEERLELEKRFDAGDIEFINKFFTPNISTEEFLKRVAAGEKEFVDICLGGLNLTGINLAGANLTGAKLLGANLSGANLTKANLSYAFLDGANLSSANLEGAILTGGSAVSANFENANLRGTIDSFMHAHRAFYHNTIMPNGSICAEPYWEEG
ncbi:pentapeptide repeat protein [Rivularia sp. IAM M-261]|nr:pentapeptide repeat protein [Rivularia sp. IAM M-261]